MKIHRPNKDPETLVNHKPLSVKDFKSAIEELKANAVPKMKDGTYDIVHIIPPEMKEAMKRTITVLGMDYTIENENKILQFILDPRDYQEFYFSEVWEVFDAFSQAVKDGPQSQWAQAWTKEIDKWRENGMPGRKYG